jgi:hypothetical protein
VSREIPEQYVGLCQHDDCCYLLRASTLRDRGLYLAPACALVRADRKFKSCPIGNWSTIPLHKPK